MLRRAKLLVRTGAVPSIFARPTRGETATPAGLRRCRILRCAPQQLVAYGMLPPTLRAECGQPSSRRAEALQLTAGAPRSTPPLMLEKAMSKAPCSLEACLWHPSLNNRLRTTVSAH